MKTLSKTLAVLWTSAFLTNTLVGGAGTLPLGNGTLPLRLDGDAQHDVDETTRTLALSLRLTKAVPDSQEQPKVTCQALGAGASRIQVQGTLRLGSQVLTLVSACVSGDSVEFVAKNGGTSGVLVGRVVNSLELGDKVLGRLTISVNSTQASRYSVNLSTADQ